MILHTMASSAFFLQTAAAPGVDWLYQFTNNLTNLTTQNGDALSSVGMPLLAFVSLIKLVRLVAHWNISTMTFSLGAQPVRLGDLVELLLQLIICLLIINYWTTPFPSAKECFLGGARKKFVRRICRVFTNLFWEEPRPQRGAESEAERRRAAGRRFGPEAVTVQKAGYGTEDSHWTEVALSRLGCGSSPKPLRTVVATVPGKEGLSPLPLRSSRLWDGTLKALRDRWAVLPEWEHDGASVRPRIRLGSLAFGLSFRLRRRGRPPRSGSSGLHGCSR